MGEQCDFPTLFWGNLFSIGLKVQQQVSILSLKGCNSPVSTYFGQNSITLGYVLK